MICKHILLITFLTSLNTFFYIQLNGSKYYYVSLTIQLNTSHLFTQLNDEIILFQTSQFNTSLLLAHSLNVKQFYLTQR